MKILFLALLVLGTSLTSFKEKRKNKIILAIVAHPDDEGAFSSVLVKLSKLNKVYVIIATDGRYGTVRGYPAGDSLAAIRQEESKCACKILGTQPPIFLGFHDGLGLKDGNGEYFKQTGELTEKLKQKIEELNPDYILTFGPDGDTGHNDHRNIGAITTEVLLREGWVEKFPLYYIAWMKKDDLKLKDATGYGLRTVNSKYYNVQLRFSEEDEDKGLASMDCYLSQSTTEERKKWKEVEKADTSNTVYFRQFVISKNKKIGF